MDNPVTPPPAAPEGTRPENQPPGDPQGHRIAGASTASPSSGSRPPALPPPLIDPSPLPRAAYASAASAAPPPRSGGWGWKVLALGLLTILLLVAATSAGGWLMGLVGAGGGMSREASMHLEEVLLEDEGGADKVAVVDVEGIIFGSLLGGGGAGPVELVREQLRRAAKDSAVKAVLLRIDSPGGEVLAADEIYRRLEEFQQRTGKPVIASMGSVAASGGYYIAAPCRWIVANPLTITGSIGVIMQGYNYRGLMDKVGVRPQVYKSGRFKDMLAGGRAEKDIPPEESRMVQALVDETFLRFKQVISEGRLQSNRLSQEDGRVLTKNWEEYADGRVFSGRQALEWGFVDELGDFRDAVKRAKALARIDRAKLIRYEQPFELGSLFRLLAQSEARGVKVDLGVQFPPLHAGRLYFLFLPGAD